MYGYVPTRAVGIIFLILFVFSTGLHCIQMIKYRMWFIIPTVILCGFLESIGWGARLWSSWEPLESMPFKIQISTTVLGPTPLLAANFVIFGRITRQLGPAYSRIRPRTYTALFCGIDVVSLLVQGGGGGIASSAKDQEGAQLGSNVMLGGIILQVVAILGFSITAIEYLVRYNKRSPFRGDIMRDAATADAEDGVRGRFRRELKIMVYALAVSIIVLFIRQVSY
ncbi:unnamed protein product [Cyclocybe aegerita]|uniref:RTA1-domain-containing protein n=1 Tax=Cyclocybe aegerita TaxID=1973307 RepID=A0A8S0VV23_CYCAE|nr:unnamed protein product [Cyclocybe aegerita]